MRDDQFAGAGSTPKVIRLEHQDERQAKLTVVDWNLGNVCNYSCSYCPPWLHDSTAEWHPAEYVLRYARQIIKTLRAGGRDAFFQFSGGEPTYHPHFLDIASELTTHKVGVGVISNGSRKASWWSEASPYLNDTCLSFHIEKASVEHFLDVLMALKSTPLIHINVPMLPSHFAECHEAARKLAART
jgi:organic radical activating enzyme